MGQGAARRNARARRLERGVRPRCNRGVDRRFPRKLQCCMARRSGNRVSPLDAHLGFWMRLLSNRVSGRFRQALETSGSSVAEWVALRELLGSRDTSHADLMTSLGMTKGAVSKVITRLEAKGLALRGPDLERRRQVIVLTEEGRRLVPKLARLADENDATFFGHLTAEERDTLMVLLRRMAKHHQISGVAVE
jgi:DNA-binding MarR family transcriptional regulator